MQHLQITIVDFKRILFVCLSFLPSFGFAQELTVQPLDAWQVGLQCKLPAGIASSLLARTKITQPQGMTRTLESPVAITDGQANWKLVYPLVDEGRFDVEPGNWSGYWKMGEYRFQVEFLDGDQIVHAAETTWDPLALCPRDNYGPIVTKYPQQWLECSPLRPAYIDTDQMQFTIRTLPERVSECTAIVNVTAAHSDQTLAGPWTRQLNGTPQQQEFDTRGWPRGEYWIRVQLQRDGHAVGAHLIRKVWKEILPPLQPAAEARQMGDHPQLCTSSAHFAATQNIRFVPNPLKKQPERPLLVMDQPWETELLYAKTLHYDTDHSQYVLEYELAGGDAERADQRAQLPSTICRAVSPDGLIWTKPALGLVTYQGSTQNNLVPAGQAYAPPPDSSSPKLAHDGQKATFRRYDPQRDGPVNLQNVFVTALKESFVQRCTDSSSESYRIGAWPMEQRGHEYLVLTPEAILYSGTGMDLYHSTEQISLHVEDPSIGTLYYYFRPGAPPYPPHDVPYDNMHMVRRCLGVMWTQDGIHWERRLIAVPDEQDAPGSQFYYNTLYAPEQDLRAARPAMALEAHWNQSCVSHPASAFGAFTIFDAKANRLWPELVAVDDLLHWRRFDSRSKLIENGPAWSYDYGLIKIAAQFQAFGNQWWFPYQAINTLHQDYIGLAKVKNLEQLQARYPNYAELPGFMDWEQYWQRCKSMRYYTGIARCAPGRVCHAEAVDGVGTLETLPFVLAGESLLVNAIIPANGLLQVEVLDESGQVLPGFERTACQTLSGDSPALAVTWLQPLSSLQGQSIRLRFLLQGSQLYGYRLQ